MQLTAHQKNNLSDYLVNISSAWFIGGIITPVFTHQLNNGIMDILIGLALSVTFLMFSWELYKNK